MFNVPTSSSYVLRKDLIILLSICFLSDQHSTFVCKADSRNINFFIVITNLRGKSPITKTVDKIFSIV